MRRPHKATASNEAGAGIREVARVSGFIPAGQVVAVRALGSHPVALRLRPAGRARGGQFAGLRHRHIACRVRLFAELARGEVVLHLEHSLARRDERCELAAFLGLEAFLVECEVEVGLEFGSLLAVVLQGDRQPQRVGGAREPLVVGQLLGGGQREARFDFKSFDVVRLDAVKALLLAHFQTRFHDRLDRGQVADVQPALVRIPGHDVAEDGFRELPRVWAPFLPGARVQIAHHVPALGVQ